ncbi:MAG TPA: cell wall hydrolase [Alphaproteobacteria bacterium]|jgi:spore germination cell wall hydrolase CwlJ-like protein|nr:cell wall hydrolase [Alphaproteobacteria bacterium]
MSAPLPGAVDAASERDVDVVARTLYGEARGQPLDGIVAVASVVMNRARRGAYGATPAEVCLRPWQFSCWNARDPNRAIIERVQPGTFLFDVCRLVAALVLRGLLPDPTGGATHYHTKGVAPDWSRGKTPSAVIGDHLFFTDID